MSLHVSGRDETEIIVAGQRANALARPDGAEDLETPIEAELQARAEREFETERQLPPSTRKAIISVNGEDVQELPIDSSHGRAA